MISEIFSVAGDISDPVIVFVMENFDITKDDMSDELHSFFITFKHEDNGGAGVGDRKHSFVADSDRNVTQWMEVTIVRCVKLILSFTSNYHLLFQALQNCSYEYKREQLILLQIKLRNKTGVDPLRSTAFEHNPVYFLSNKPTRELTLLRPPPSPPGRKLKQKNNVSSSSSARTSSFTSHIGDNNWETFDENENSGANRKKSEPLPTFKSHLVDKQHVPASSSSKNLIDF